MRQIKFVTPTKLSLLDITTMGDSSKRDDDSLIGTFDSGLKYAIALLLRNDVNISINVFGNKEDIGVWEESFTTNYEFSTYIDSDHKRDKELIQIECSNIYHGGSALNQHNIQEPSTCESYVVKTAFAKNLGFNWELWMALRELYSNMLDEKGYYTEEDADIEEGTIICLTFEEDSAFNTIWEERENYIIEREDCIKISDRLSLFSSPDNTLRIFKNNILVYEDNKTNSRFNFNIDFGEIDERRVLTALHGVSHSIVSDIASTTNEEFLRSIITSDFKLMADEFLYNNSCYEHCSDLIHNIAYEVEQKYGSVNSYKWLLGIIKEREDCKISGKKIETIKDSLWGYNRTVVVESQPKIQEISLKELIENEYNFKINYEIKECALSGSSVIADKFEKCILVSPEFDLKEDFPKFLVQYFILSEKGNIIDIMSEYITKLIKK